VLDVAGSLPSLVEFNDFRASLCAGVCCRLPLFGASKGHEKGNVSKKALQRDDGDRVLAKDTSWNSWDRSGSNAGGDCHRIIEARMQP
jgi:hypothetical protein